MKRAVTDGKGGLEILDGAIPEREAGFVRVRVRSTGICGSDLHALRGHSPAPAGMQPGHEISGVVDDADTDSGIAPGTPVVIEPVLHCSTCPQCLSGNYNRCGGGSFVGFNARGGMAEYLVVPASAVFPVPVTIPVETAALVEPLAVCMRGVRIGQVGLHSKVAVLGGGSIGLISALVAKASGAAEVHITARHPVQQEAARALGLTVWADSGALANEAADSFDSVIETVGGSSDTLKEAIRLAAPGGTISVVGVFSADVPVPATRLVRKELTMAGSYCYARAGSTSDYALAIDFLASNLDALAPLVTHTFPLARVNDAFATAFDKKSGSIKVHVRP